MSKNEETFGSQKLDVWKRAKVTHEDIYATIKHPSPNKNSQNQCFVKWWRFRENTVVLGGFSAFSGPLNRLRCI